MHLCTHISWISAAPNSPVTGTSAAVFSLEDQGNFFKLSTVTARGCGVGEDTYVLGSSVDSELLLLLAVV